MYDTTNNNALSSSSTMLKVGRRKRLFAPSCVTRADAVVVFTGAEGDKENMESRGLISGGQRRTVRFNLANNQVHKDRRNLSADEIRSCWFTKQEIRDFNLNQAAVVAHLFSKRRSSNWRESFCDAYSECRRVKRGDMECLTGTVDRDGLAHEYQREADLVGMESYILLTLRGPVSKQIARVLSYLGERETQSVQAGPEASQAAFIHKCRCMTQPSSVLMHEIAVAQAAALGQE